MPVPTIARTREPSKLPRPLTANSSIPRPSWNHPPKINANQEEKGKNRQNSRPRPSTSRVRTEPRTCRVSLDLVPARSRYCLTEDSRKMRIPTKTSPKEERPEPRPAEGGHGCDVKFLKKLLAMNKKQETVINMKLVEMMKEPESEVPRDDRWCDKKKPVEKQVATSSLVETQSGGRSERWQLTSQRELEYDMNGRRVYHFSDEDNERGNAETWIANTTTVIETTADGGESASKRQSLTVIKQPARSRRTEQDGDRGCKGEKLVVHCVASDKACTKKRLLKVWNYKSLLNSGEGGEGDGGGENGQRCLNNS